MPATAPLGNDNDSLANDDGYYITSGTPIMFIITILVNIHITASDDSQAIISHKCELFTIA